MSIEAKNLKAFRGLFGLTQKKLAEILGYSKQAISKYETGDRPIPLELLDKLSKMLNISINSFIDSEMPELKISTLKPIDIEKIRNFNRFPYCLDKFETKNDSYNRALSLLKFLCAPHKNELTSESIINCYKFSIEAFEELENEASATNCLSCILTIINLFPAIECYYGIDFDKPIFLGNLFEKYLRGKVDSKGDSKLIVTILKDSQQIIRKCINILKESSDKNYRDLGDYYAVQYMLIDGVNSPQEIEHANHLLLLLLIGENPYAIKFFEMCKSIISLQLGDFDAWELLYNEIQAC